MLCDSKPFSPPVTVPCYNIETFVPSCGPLLLDLPGYRALRQQVSILYSLPSLSCSVRVQKTNFHTIVLPDSSASVSRRPLVKSSFSWFWFPNRKRKTGGGLMKFMSMPGYTADAPVWALFSFLGAGGGHFSQTFVRNFKIRWNRLFKFK